MRELLATDAAAVKSEPNGARWMHLCYVMGTILRLPMVSANVQNRLILFFHPPRYPLGCFTLLSSMLDTPRRADSLTNAGPTARKDHARRT